LNFLLEYLEQEIMDNTFSNGYDNDRAFKDGQAKEAYKILELLKGLENG
tara:strand:- start:1008 stop:1154 length:147 start_codon:yes stop_codon:yes gene_type:complete